MTFRRWWCVVGVMAALCAGGCGGEAVGEPAQAPPVDVAPCQVLQCDAPAPVVVERDVEGLVPEEPCGPDAARLVSVNLLRGEIHVQRRAIQPGARIDRSIEDLIKLQLSIAELQLGLLAAEASTGACR